MDRRYYGLKALILTIALSAAAFGGGFECSRVMRSHNPNYEAAFVAQAAIVDAGTKIRQSVGRFFAHAFADL